MDTSFFELYFWDIILTIYIVGLVIGFALAYYWLPNPKCYRIPSAAVIAILWPIAVAIALVLYLEGLIAMLKEWLIGEDS